MAHDQGVTVLVADDGRDNREFIVEHILRPRGFTPLLARDGQEAMALVRQHRPDIILLDLQMPRMNGMQVLEALLDEGFDIPVILMTFHGSEEIAIEVFRKGVRDYVMKPYTVDEMEEAIEHTLGEVRLRREKDALTERLLSANAALNRRVRELNTLYQIGKSVTALVGMDQLLTRIIDAATQVIGAEQGSLLLLESDQLVCRAVKHNNAAPAEPVHEFSSDRIAWQAVKTGKPVVLSPQELAEARAQNPAIPAAVAAIPLQVGDRVVGVLSVANHSASARAFTRHDGAMLSALGDYAAIAIENARIYKALESSASRQAEILRGALARYVPPGVIEQVLDDPAAAALEGQRREVTALFAGLRGFTAYSAGAEPGEALALLNEYRRLATDVIFSREGTLVTTQGDLLMAVFNAPTAQPDHALRAADAALALQRATAERMAGRDALGFAIGLHAGEAVVGATGPEHALDYTVIGAAITLARHLHEQARPGEILLTAKLVAHLDESIRAQEVGELALPGDADPVGIYRLVGLG
jgi:class 3 adenylate cyclase/CheY-like chemotaxis protein